MYIETLWDQMPWHRGCPVGLPSPGTLIEFGPRLRQRVGRIHWAGTETATFWHGYMDGAVRSGERAAAEVLPLLTSRRPRRPGRTRRRGRGASPSLTG